MAAEEEEGETGCGPSDSTVVGLYEDESGPDVYVGMDTDLQTRRCCPCPPQCCRLPWGVVKGGTAGSMRPRVSTSTASRDSGQQAATSLAGALERFELQPPGLERFELQPPGKVAGEVGGGGRAHAG